MSAEMNRTRRLVGIGIFLLAFAFFEGMGVGYRPRFWGDLVDQLAPNGTVAILSAFLALAVLLAGIAAVAMHVLITFVAPRPPTAARAALQTVVFFAGVFLMSIAVRVAAPLLVGVVQAVSVEARLP